MSRRGGCAEPAPRCTRCAGMSPRNPSIQEVAARILRDFGAADALINNAGISLIVPAEHTSADQWQRVMNVNLLGPFLLCKHLGAQMLAQGRGSIVNVGVGRGSCRSQSSRRLQRIGNTA